jgi:hypothetical protein
MLRLDQKIQKYRSGQTLYEDVCELGGRQYVQDVDIINGNAFSDEVRSISTCFIH